MIHVYWPTYVRRHSVLQTLRKKKKEIKRERASFLADIPPICAWSTVFVPTINHDCAAAEPQTRPAYTHTTALPEEPIRLGTGVTGPSLWRGEYPKHGAAARDTPPISLHNTYQGTI
jgi:hypothetical protein